jgi:hypothetical protein
MRDWIEVYLSAIVLLGTGLRVDVRLEIERRRRQGLKEIRRE